MTEGVETGGITQDGCAVLPTEKQEGAAGGVRPATSRRVYRPPELVRMRKTVGVACAGEMRPEGRGRLAVRCIVASGLISSSLNWHASSLTECR